MTQLIGTLFFLVIYHVATVLLAPGGRMIIGRGDFVDPDEAIRHILNYDKPSAERYSWILPIHFNSSTYTEFGNCAADLISSKFLLTAAHCLCMSPEFENSPYVDVDMQILLIGRPSPSTSVDRSNANFYKVKNYTCHSGWNEHDRLGPDDIAIIELFTEIKEVEPVKLASPDLILSGTEKLTAVGWGLDENHQMQKYLKKVELIQAENGTAQCAEHYDPHGYLVNKSHAICTIATKGKDACSGDSGGPLLLKIKNIDILVGTTSFGYSDDCAPIGQHVWPSIFTDVRHYIKWIDTFIQ